MRINRSPDGSLWIGRNDPELEAQLDSLHVRTRAGELRWWPTPKVERVDAADLAGRWTGRRAIVVGKGPSVERIPQLEISDGDLIATVNEAALLPSLPRVDVAVVIDAPAMARVVPHKRPATLLLQPAGPILEPGVTAIGEGVFDRGMMPTSGAVPVLLRILAIGGVVDLLMVGCDAFDKPAERGAVYAPAIRALKVPDRASGDFGPINAAIADEIERAGLVATWLHRLPKPKVKKGA